MEDFSPLVKRSIQIVLHRVVVIYKNDDCLSVESPAFSFLHRPEGLSGEGRLL